MKKYFIIISVIALIALAACTKDGDVDTDLKGKTFVYHNGEYGDALIRETYRFEANGNVYNKSEVGKLPAYDTSGTELYYKMDGTKFTIYYGTKGWKKDVQHTEYAKGEYFIDYILIGDKKYMKK